MTLVDCLLEDSRWQALKLEALAEKAAKAALAELGLPVKGYEISLLGCSDTRIAALNADFRGKPQPTNVLSWPSEDRAPAAPGTRPALPPPGGAIPVELGDIALAYETCTREAAEAGRPPSAHVTHLVVHGVLHLFGFDHETDADAEVMEGLETAILAKLGLPDPYAVAGQGARVPER